VLALLGMWMLLGLAFGERARVVLVLLLLALAFREVPVLVLFSPPSSSPRARAFVASSRKNRVRRGPKSDGAHWSSRPSGSDPM
jgi:hypothetical protein